MIEGILALGVFGLYGAYKLRSVSKEHERFRVFIEKVTFQNIPFQKRKEMGYDVYFYQEDKFSLEIWKKPDGFIMYVNDDEIKKPIFRIQKNENGVQVVHPTIFYYRTLFEKKRKLFQAFVHRYIGDDFLQMPVEESKQEAVTIYKEDDKLPAVVSEKVKEIQVQYDALMEKQEELDIEAYTLMETLVTHDLKQILHAYRELTPESQAQFEADVLEGLGDIQNHLHNIEKRLENVQVRELKKKLRVVKERGD